MDAMTKAVIHQTLFTNFKAVPGTTGMESADEKVPVSQRGHLMAKVRVNAEQCVVQRADVIPNRMVYSPVGTVENYDRLVTLSRARLQAAQPRTHSRLYHPRGPYQRVISLYLDFRRVSL